MLRKIRLLELCGQRKEQFSLCEGILIEANPCKVQGQSPPCTYGFGETGNDWAVWMGMLTAASFFKAENVGE